jgi:hypothetical protein
LSADGIEGEQGAREASERKRRIIGYRTLPAADGIFDFEQDFGVVFEVGKV